MWDVICNHVFILFFFFLPDQPTHLRGTEGDGKRSILWGWPNWKKNTFMKFFTLPCYSITYSAIWLVYLISILNLLNSFQCSCGVTWVCFRLYAAQVPNWTKCWWILHWRWYTILEVKRGSHMLLKCLRFSCWCCLWYHSNIWGPNATGNMKH